MCGTSEELINVSPSVVIVVIPWFFNWAILNV